MAGDGELSAMRRAITLAAAALGSTNPNPCVGAVVIDAGGNPLGVGVTAPVGGPHAEIVALQSAGHRAVGATLVVTLEPCAHDGRTGPCVAAIVAAGITRVVYAVTDPHKIAAGGATQLAAAGVEVEAGVLATEAAPGLYRWSEAIAFARTHLTWKYASTLDGRVAAGDGSSKWITGAEARRDVHHERYLADAVIAGVGTVIADDPQLAVRDWPASRQPTRVIVDSEARTPLGSKVLDSTASTVIVAAEDADSGRRAALVAAGAELIGVPRLGGRVDLRAMLSALFDRELLVGFVEGGPTLATGLVRAGLVDRVIAYYGPVLLGAGAALLGDIGVATLSGAPRLVIESVTTIGSDLRVDAQFAKRSV